MVTKSQRLGLQVSKRDHGSVIQSLRASVYLLKLEIIMTRLD